MEELDDFDYFVKSGITDEEIDQNCKYFEQHPLFMKQQQAENVQENELALAMQNLLYNDTPENIARCLNDNANKLLKEHLNDKNNDYYLKSALKIYDDAILQNSSNKLINCKLHSNRALINFKRKNYGKVIEDCQKAIQYDNNFIRAYYRLAQAYFCLDKFQDALDQINICFKLDIKNQDVLKFKKEIQNKIEIEKEKYFEKQEKLRIINSEIHQLCKKKGIQLINKNTDIPATNEVDMEVLAEDHFSTPILLFYPQFQNSDFIQRTLETDVFTTHLQKLLPLPWDQPEHYQLQNIVCFLEIKIQNRIIFKRVDHNQTILQILQTKSYKAPMMLQIYVLSFKSPFFQIFLDNSEVEK